MLFVRFESYLILYKLQVTILIYAIIYFHLFIVYQTAK